MKIYSVQQYEKFEGDDPLTPGRVLRVFAPIPDACCGDTEVVYVGQAQLGNQMFQFPIGDVNSVEQAFERFDACAEVHAEKLKSEARKTILKAPLMPNAPKNGRIQLLGRTEPYPPDRQR